MRILVLGVIVSTLAACTSGSADVEVPSNHGHALDDALRRLHSAGLRASFPAATTACGNGLPWVIVQTPRAPARVPRNSVVEIRFGYSPIPSPGYPTRHAKFTTVPDLVGREFAFAAKQLHAIWPCVQVRPATGTSGTRVVVMAQKPKPGTRLPAYGVIVGRGFRPTTVDLTIAVEEPSADSKAAAAILL